jgi:uncharacterized membrane protein YvbJ
MEEERKVHKSVYRKGREKDFRKEKEFLGRKSIVAIAFMLLLIVLLALIFRLLRCFES